MIRAIVSLLMTFSLLVAPLAHSSAQACDSQFHAAHGTLHSLHDLSLWQADSDTSPEALHVCCGQHVSAMTAQLSVAAPLAALSLKRQAVDEPRLLPWASGPPLKPPSRL